jgi:RHS repeat-associated protein
MNNQGDTKSLKIIAGLIPTCLTLLCWTSFAVAQAAPNDYQIGTPTHGDFSGTGFESVQLNNGNLHIEIPLWSAAGRGPSVGFNYVYDSLGWGYNETCNRFTGLCTDSVTANPVKAGVVANHLKLTLVSLMGYQVKSTHVSYTCSGNIQVTNYSYNMSAPDGTHHHFMPDPIEAGPEQGYCFPHPTTLYADDGSGWMLQIDQSTGNVAKLVRKDGTQGGTEDTNGNEILTTDTLGRQFNSDGSYYDSSGTLRSIQVTYQTLSVQTNLCWASPGDFCNEYSSSTWTVPQVITLPNGMTYTFTYNQNPTGSYYGQPLSVTLPTGGQITWGWNGELDTGPNLTSRQLSGDPAPWTYGNGATVTDPAGNQMVATCGNYNPPLAPPGSTPLCYIITKKYYQGAATGTPVKTIQTDYWTTSEPAILPIHETTTWNQQNLVSRTETDYDSFSFSGTYIASAGNPTEKREFGYGTGTWGAQVRTTDYGYLHLTSSSYLNLNIVNRVTSTKVYAGTSQTGTLTAQMLNTYDGVAIAVDTSSTPAPNHDYTNFPASYNLRGNLTQVSRGLKSGSTWTWLNTNNTYNDLGEIVESTDPLGHHTFFDYTDSWATIQNPQCVTSTHSYGFLTTITDPLGHRTKHTYYSCTSVLGSTQDENDIAASRPGATYSYDLMGRVTSENFPDGGQTTLSYNDSVPYTQTATQLIRTSPLLNRVTTTVHDGLGRVQQTQLVDPDCSSGPVKVDYTYGYDASPPTGIPAGRFTTVSNPYCQTSDSTYGITKTRYDALDRPVLVIPPDGTDTTNNQSTSYAANVVTVIDQAGKQRKQQTDALGRLTTVWEDPNTLNYETDYGYDVLNDMTSVIQKGNAASGSWRTRTFTYDSLARLTCAANPEITPGLSTVNPASCPASYTGVYTNGTVGYAYDADSNLTTRTAPAPNQTSISSTVVTTFSYDQDNRLISKSYTGSPTTATAQYGYDGTALTGCGTTPPTITPVDANPIHSRTSMCDGSGATSWSHDPMGRELIEKRTINGTSAITDRTVYAYYKDGELSSLTYPSGRVLTYYPNSAGRTLSVSDSSTTYVSGTTYAPQGAIGGLIYGASIHGGFSYNSRLQPLQIAYDATNPPTVTGNTCPSSPGSIMQRLYDFHAGTVNNGDVYVINNCKDTNRTQNFSYDNLNRITQAYTTGNSPLTTSWGETFTIDAWGNLTNKAGVTGKTNTENLNVAPATVKNQLNGLCNDAAGNLVLNTACPTGTFTPTYSYDIENRLTSAAAGYSYVYDGDGQRVKKCSNSGCTTGTLYWPGAGAVLDESGLSGTFNEEYVFFSGARVARIDLSGCSSNCVHYYFTDHLGSADVITSSTGTIQKESDYYPYGGELVVSGSDINNYKFTGKERDSESGLDNFGARYNSSSLGRFMTPDWAARPTAVPYAVMGDPQSLNLYGYVRNDPVSQADLDGHAERDAIVNQGDVNPFTYGFDMGTPTGMSMTDSQLEARSEEFRAETGQLGGHPSQEAQQKQGTPTSLKVLSATALPVADACGRGHFGIQIDIEYQVMDGPNGKGNPVKDPTMVPIEEGKMPLRGADGKDTYGPQPLSPKPTTANGTFHDSPVGFCAAYTPFKDKVTTQKISMKMSDGTVIPVRSNVFTMSSPRSGYGTVTNGSDITVTQ